MKYFGILLIIAANLALPMKAYAIEDPLIHSNNKFGIHILFPSELEQAARLVNSSGGDWGYVTIPIQSGDKDFIKWQQFMDEARRLHLIPIVRLATEGDYFNTSIWRKPTLVDVLDFANFLGDLNWPTQNRYIVVFNEVNRADEWGSSPNAQEYTDVLAYAVEIFKAKNQDFFIISAGLDNGADNSDLAINQYDFIRQMYAYNPEIFITIDAIASHSYPNPDFSQPPHLIKPTSIWSYQYERKLIRQLSGTDLPVFITETGWRNDKRDENIISSFYRQAFAAAWSDENIVAITPFLLQAGTEPFKYFSFLKDDGVYTQYYAAYSEQEKPAGAPLLSFENTSLMRPQTLEYKVRSFNKSDTIKANVSIFDATKEVFYWIMKIEE